VSTSFNVSQNLNITQKLKQYNINISIDQHLQQNSFGLLKKCSMQIGQLSELTNGNNDGRSNQNQLFEKNINNNSIDNPLSIS